MIFYGKIVQFVIFIEKSCNFDLKIYFCFRCHIRHLQGRFCPFGFVLKPVCPETLILSELGVFFDVKKYRFCETMLVELSTVGFAPLGSY